MKYLNFIIGSISWIPYFIPIVIEGNKRELISYFFIRKNRKPYANPYSKIHIQEIIKITNKYNIEMKEISEVIKFPGLTFLMEGDISGTDPRDYYSSGLLYLNSTHLKVSFTFNADFIWQYEKYINNIDYVVLPGKSYAYAYNKISPKNLYLGSPKFDIPLNEDDIYKKYKMNPKHKYLLFFYPKKKWINQCKRINNHYQQITYLVNLFHKMGYKVIIKTREKDRLKRSVGDYYFEETDIFPISSLELLKICNLAVFFSSASIEECLMSSTPFIDFKVDEKFDRFAFLHNPAYSRIINNLAISFTDLSSHVTAITEQDNNEIFKKMQEKHMFINKDFSEKLLDTLSKEAEFKYNNSIKVYSQINDLKKKYSEISKKKNNVIPLLNKLKEINNKLENNNNTN
jgi:hypothetical protein